MQIGIVLPSADEVVGREVLTWAREAEQAGFAALAVTDRIAYPGLEALATLACAGAVTEWIELMTAVLLAPVRDTAMLVKQVETIERIAGAGRLTLGLGVGSRPDDYDVTERRFDERGKRLDAQLAALRSADPPLQWPILLGGTSPATLRRAATASQGWVSLPGARAFAAGAPRVVDAWRDAARDGMPRLVGAVYTALDEDGGVAARRALSRYYAFAGERMAAQLASDVCASPREIRASIDAHATAGCDLLLLMPVTGSPSMVARLAAAARNIDADITIT